MNCFLFGLLIVTWTILPQNVVAGETTNSAIQPTHEGIYWGVETNGVKAGLYIEKLRGLSGMTNRIPIRCHPLLCNNSTNNGNLGPGMLMFYLPPIENRYRIELTNEQGNVVGKTAKGKALGKPFVQPSIPTGGVKISTGWHPGTFILLAKEVRGLPEFMLQDYFKIADPGKYHLHFEMSVLKPSPSDADQVELTWFPPVDAEIQIELNK